ncbi:hypothetical protein ACFQMM_22615 [Saliphagus sp. GCM10025308]
MRGSLKDLAFLHLLFEDLGSFLENDMFDPFPWDTRFSFKEYDFQGRGEQMAWLSEEDGRLEQYQPEQIETGEQIPIDHWRERPDVDGQTEWGDWL